MPPKKKGAAAAAAAAAAAVPENPMARLRDCLEHNDLDGAEPILDALLAPGAALVDTDIFTALCIRASIAALQQSAVAKVSELLSHPAATGSREPEERALAHYIAGTARLHKTVMADSAQRHFSDALNADPHFTVARLGQASVFFAGGEYRKCFRDLCVVLRDLGSLAPPIVRVGMGICAFKLGEDGHALKCLLRASQVDEEDPLALLGLFAVYTHQRKLEEAAKVVKKLYASHQTATVVQKFADVAFFQAVANGDIAARAPAIRKLIERGRADAGELESASHTAHAELQLGRLEHALGHAASAREHYTAALAATPGCAASQLHDAEAAHGAGGPEAVLALLVPSGSPGVDGKGVIGGRRGMTMTIAAQTELGLHTGAMKLAKLLTESIAVDDPAAFAVAAWANRLDPQSFADKASVAARLRVSCNQPVDKYLAVDEAVLSGDTAGVAAAAKEMFDLDLATPGARTDPATGPIPAAAVPLVFNYALLLESTDSQRSRVLYTALVKQHPAQREPFERLTELARAAGNDAEAIAWAALHRRVRPNDDFAAVNLAATLASALKIAKAMAVLPSDANASIEVRLCKGALYLRDAQRSFATEGESSSARENRIRKIKFALEQFQMVVRQDPHNVLAAHGAACCIALSGDVAHAAPLLKRVDEVRCNAVQAQRGVKHHVFNSLLAQRSYREAIAAARRDEAASGAEEAASRHHGCALALCHAQLGEFDRSIDLLTAQYKKRPGDATVALFLVQTLRASVLDAMVAAGEAMPAKQADALTERLDLATQYHRYADVAAGPRGDAKSAALRDAKRFIERKCHVRDSLQSMARNAEREAKHKDAAAEAWTETQTQHLERQKQSKQVETEEESRRREVDNAQARREHAAIVSGYFDPHGTAAAGTEADSLKRPRDGEDAAAMADQAAAEDAAERAALEAVEAARGADLLEELDGLADDPAGAEAQALPDTLQA